MRLRKRPAFCVAATAVILTAMAMQRVSLAATDDPQVIQRQVMAAIDEVPHRVGVWVGVDLPSPFGAEPALKPSRMLSRRYRVRDEPHTVDLLVEYCVDARDLSRHYPTQSFRQRGWTLAGAQVEMYRIGEVMMPVTMYRFEQVLPGRDRQVEVASAVIRGDGLVFGNLDTMMNTWAQPGVRDRGVAQFQLIFHTPMQASRQREVVAGFLEGCGPVMRSLRKSQGD